MENCIKKIKIFLIFFFNFQTKKKKMDISIYKKKRNIFYTFFFTLIEISKEMIFFSLFSLVPQRDWIFRSILDSTQLSDRMFFTVSISLLHFFLFFGSHFFYTFLDKFELFQQYKIKIKAKNIAEDDLVKKTLKEALFGQLIIQPISLYFL